MVENPRSCTAIPQYYGSVWYIINYQEVLRMDSVVIYLIQSVLPVLVGTSGEPH